MSRSRSNSSSSSSSDSSDGHRPFGQRAQAARNLGTATLIQMAQSVIATLSPPPQEPEHENSPLLSLHSRSKSKQSNPKVRAIVWAALTSVTLAALVILLGFQHALPNVVVTWLGGLPSDPLAAALVILDEAPVIVSHFKSYLMPCSHYASGRTHWQVAKHIFSQTADHAP